MIPLDINLYKRQTDKDASPVEGWMTKEELEWLGERAKEMETIVEIGSWRGRSTKALLENLDGTLWCIDPWMYDGYSYSEFIKNTHAYQNLIIMKMKSLLAAKFFPEKSIDMVFIDANHTYLSVKSDILKWTPIARKLICGHDYGQPEYPGVKYAVDKHLGDARIVDHIWYKELHG